MIFMEGMKTPKDVIKEGMNPICLKPLEQCGPAIRAVANISERIEAGEEIDPKKVGEELGRCALGATTIGQCGTEKSACRHGLVENIEDPNEQASQLEIKLVEFTSN